MSPSISLHHPVYRIARAFSNGSREILQSVYQVVFPPVCLSCESFLPETSLKICPECHSTMERVNAADSLYLEMQQRLCGDGVVDGLVSAFYFEQEGGVQTLIHRLKYAEMPVVGIELGKYVAVALAGLLHAVPDAVIIPVPLHRAKVRERGYNQSDYIARGISNLTGLPVHTRLLRRRRFTATQTRLNREERRANVRDAFEVNRTITPNASFILVDDVITTGATILECARVLRRYGAARVYAASAALASYSMDQET
ncbi:MAG TPA: phosphoribosyltransferase family protein [Bacteroidota bacterium]|nr:phosphoribosyltransferase family protein [Bacteroidota bacterium]